MKFAMMCLATVSSLAVALGSKPSPYYYYEQIFDRAVEAVQSESLRPAAMQLLRDAAEGRPDKVSSDTVVRIGLSAAASTIFKEAFAKDPGVRARAYRAIGRTGLPEALQYLQSLTATQVGNLGPRDSHEAWPAAQIALQEARLLAIKAPQQQVAFLEKAMADSYDSYSTAKIHLWAMAKLCDMGSSASLPAIEKRLRSLYSRIGEAESSFCRERVQVVKRHPDRAKALGSVLNIGTSGTNQRLTRWAIGELAAMKTPDAKAELDRFAAEIRAIPPLARNPVLATFAEQIDRIRRAKP